MIVQTEGSSIAQVGKWLAMGQEQLPRDAVVEVAVSALSVADSPRMAGEDPEHIQALAVAQTELPPILVHHSTMRVIDGVHRLRVAKLRGDEYIAARFFSGDEKDAFVLAVKSNITHGLPLCLADRKAAAARIIRSHPQWSDRMIASVVGLAARTVGEIRRQDTCGAVQVQSRIGQDGRVRPINAAGGRILASQLIADNPGLSLREVARTAGISPETVRDVRNRLGRGEDPVPGRRAGRKPEPTEKPGPRRVEPAVGPVPSRHSRESQAAVIGRLKADPALRFTETGRTLLRLLYLHMMKAEEWENIAENIPPHCGGIIASLARECAQMWKEFAELVERNLADIA
jgi:ParB-like nuclease domain